MIHWSRLLVIAVMIAGVVLLAHQLFPSKRAVSGVPESVLVPETLSDQARIGKAAFETNCAQCHGATGAGTDRGPPLAHIIYNPGHHPDQSFFLAAKIGVRSHHWNFGDMPPQPHVSEQQLGDIVRYVRALQEANGIFYSPHRM